MISELTFRANIVSIARSWIGTPYHHRAKVKGAGVDCAMVILAIFQEAGIAPADDELHNYSPDWWQHTDQDSYMRRVLRHAYKTVQGRCLPTTEAKDGCIVLTRACGSKVFNHGGVVTYWPHMVHCLQPACNEVNAARDPFWASSEIAIYDPWLKYVEEHA
jgi:cell wall-associated NlpC family hydrolase